MLHKTGSSVDFRIGADTDAEPGRAEPVAGDQRLVIAPFQGKLTAVLYRYVVPGATDRRSFSSLVGTVVVDAVQRVGGAELAAAEDETGYVLEAAIPLEDMGFQPQPGQNTNGDFGVIWSGPMGKRNAARCSWANKAAGIVSDLPSETRIHPDLWGEIVVD